MDPLISVIIPNYNRENVIYETICNVLTQTYKNIELIVVDDCSDDNSLNEIKKVEDARLTYIISTSHRGANACRNAGVKVSHGEYIAFQDSGTFWTADKLEKQLNRLRESPDAALVYCMISIEEGNRTVCLPDESMELIYKEEKCAETLSKGNIIDTPTIMVTRKCFQEIGGFDEELLRWQDYDFVIRVAMRYSIVIVNEILARSQNYSNSISMNYEYLVKSIPVFIKKHKKFYKSYGMLEGTIKNIVDYLIFSYMPNVLCVEYLAYLNEQLKDIAFNLVMDYYNDYMDFIKDRDRFNEPLTVYNFKCFIENIHQGQSFYIYGAGQVALELIRKFKSIICLDQIQGLIVTNKDDKTELEGIPIISLDELNKLNNEKELPILIGVAERTQLEIFDILKKQGFKNIYILRHGLCQYIV